MTAAEFIEKWNKGQECLTLADLVIALEEGKPARIEKAVLDVTKTHDARLTPDMLIKILQKLL